MTLSTSPVRLEGVLDQQETRWLWLLKWILVIPHYVVLVFLWLAFVVMTAVAFVAILVTGRYPRGIFQFNVGVLRWSWRVAFYAYGALGTDRYPPFSLGEVEDYPAHLDVDYPERLSRGLVLVKWWLLAIPHYLVVGLFVGSGWFALRHETADGDRWSSGGGLIGLLVLVAAVVLLFTGRYPRPLFDLVLGLNRWVLRVAAYAALMTDVYPPFRLDQGGQELRAEDPGAPPVRQPTGPTPPSRPWGGGRVVALVLGGVLLASALALGAVGTFLGVAHTVLRDENGYVMTGAHNLSSETYAVVSPSFEVHADAPAERVPERLLGKVRITAQPPPGSEPVFLGIGRTADVERYFEGVEHDTVDHLSEPGGATYDTSPGGPPPGPPSGEGFWVSQDAGTGPLSVSWSPRNGDWTIVLMSADAGAGVTASVEIGATAPFLGWATAAVLAFAGLLAVASIGLLVAALRQRGQPEER